MSVIDVHIQSRGVMAAEDLYDFLQSDAEKTVDIDAETGKITAVSEGITKPRIAVNNICNGRDSCLVHSTDMAMTLLDGALSSALTPRPI